MHAILCDFIYWLNSNILSFSDGIGIPQKSLFLPTFSWDLSLFLVLKEWRQFKEKNSPSYLKLFLFLSNADSFFFYCKKCQPSFSSFGIINRIICFSEFEFIFEILAGHISFSLIYKILRAIAGLFFSRAIVGLFFSKFFKASIFDGWFIPFHLYCL